MKLFKKKGFEKLFTKMKFRKIVFQNLKEMKEWKMTRGPLVACQRRPCKTGRACRSSAQVGFWTWCTLNTSCMPSLKSQRSQGDEYCEIMSILKLIMDELGLIRGTPRWPYEGKGPKTSDPWSRTTGIVIDCRLGTRPETTKTVPSWREQSDWPC